MPPEILPLLGTVPDAELARRFGLNRCTVRYWRRERGIDACPGARGVKPQERPYDAELGRRSDADIAREYGVTRAAVSERRRRRGIAAFSAA